MKIKDGNTRMKGEDKTAGERRRNSAPLSKESLIKMIGDRRRGRETTRGENSWWVGTGGLRPGGISAEHPQPQPRRIPPRCRTERSRKSAMHTGSFL